MTTAQRKTAYKTEQDKRNAERRERMRTWLEEVNPGSKVETIRS